MRFNTLFFLLSLSCLYFALAQVSYDDCCLKYVKQGAIKHIKHAVTYRLQETDGGCNIRAIVFTLRKGRVICANPKQDWVKKVMNYIDNRKKSGEKPNNKHFSQIRG